MKYRLTPLLTALGLMLALPPARADYHALGYSYLSPVPEAEYCPVQTCFVLVRFSEVLPADVTNLLTSFITVNGASSGNHPGSSHLAGDGKTLIFTMSDDFMVNELVTVTLNPELRPGAAGTVLPFQYRFMISTHLPDPGIISARGDTPPSGSKTNAFDGNPTSKWVDLVVPDGATNFSWIQRLYPGTETHVVNQYALTPAADSPERDPKDWRFYGVDQSTNLVLLHVQTNQVFSNRSQRNTYTVTNTIGYRGYRLEITRVDDPATATAVQLAEIQMLEPTGTLLREYWLGIPGTAVTDLTGNANYPDNPSGSSQLSSFEAPINWNDDYGTRIRGYITAPSTGSFVFWISSDDAGELWLSTNDNPANKQLIASVPGWTNPRQWNKYTQQQSVPIVLTAGQKYYVEALHKEGGGGDNVAVGWAKPGEATASPSEVIPAAVLSPWTDGALAQPVSASLSGTSSASPKNVRKSLGYPLIMPNGVSVPSDFPQINITVNDNPDPEYIFIDTRGGGGKPYNVIFDNSGSPIWYQLMPDERRDMKVQHNGMLTMLAREGGFHFVGLDTNYVEVANYSAVNGYDVDEHELQVLADGTYFLIGIQSQTVDMSRYVAGGDPAAWVTEQIIQGFTPAGELIFQWRAWDHLDIRDERPFIDITASGFDFPHMNAIDVDTDGHVLLSSRNTSECTKINRDTGEIIWRLGGARNQFTFLNDPLTGPRQQHAVRVVATNHYLLFDNGNLHDPQVSRGVEYLLDTASMTATIVWQYPETPTTSLYSFYMGNTQRLPNGNTLINWAVGNLPKLTEVRPDGTKAYEMNWADGYEAYRVWRCPWQGVALKPNLIIEPYSDKVTLIFNKFGDTNVAYYRIYGGTTPQPTNVLATTPVTLANLRDLQNQVTYYFRVTAVGRDGTESAYSDEQSVFVNITRPGQNMVVNGDFSLGTNSWIWTNNGTASATWSVTNGVAYIHPISPGTALSDIQLRQAGLRLVLSNRYVLAFDAWAASRRAMEVRVGQNQAPWTTYKVAAPTLTTTRQRFSYPFVMVNATDLDARVMFNLGVSSIDVFLDNVAVFKPASGDFNQDGRVNFLDLSVFTSQWLRQGSGLSADLDGNATVDFKDFGILGQDWSGP